MSPSVSALINSRPVVVALALLLCAPFFYPTVSSLTYADQILKKNLYFIVSQTGVSKKMC
jgi:hypothetical protein